MNAFLLVGLGGSIGAMARFGVGRLIGSWPSGWPLATFSVNIIGGLLMGLLAALVWRPGGEAVRLFLGTGVLGGFTTFSAFSLEVMLLIERGTMMTAMAYAALSVLLAVMALALGLGLGRLLS